MDSWALWLSPVVLGIFGLLVGSFLNVVVYRKPVAMMRDWFGEVAAMLQDAEAWRLVFGQAHPADVAKVGARLSGDVEALPAFGLSKPRSRCPACGHEIRWYENIPVVSWLALRGRCSACGTRIPLRYPLVELATGALFACAAWKFGPHPVTLAWCAVIALLVAMALIDMDTTYLPDDLTLPLLWGGLVVAALGVTIPLSTAVWGAIAGYVPLWLLAKAFELLMKRQGMGGGDLKLLAALGAWLGWQAVLPIILMASIVGLCVNVPRALLGRHGRWKQYPFGPFLAGGGLLVIFVGVDRVLAQIGFASLG